MKFRKVKVLHVFDTAGVASIIAQEVRRLGHSAKVMTRFDPFNITREYCGTLVEGRYRKFLAVLFKELLFYRPDVVHIHHWLGGINVIRKLNRLVRFRQPKIVFHAHGSELRPLVGTGSWRRSDYKVDVMIAATSDIQLDGMIYLPNPIDTARFHPLDDPKRGSERERKAVYFRTLPKDCLDAAERYCEQHDLLLTVVDRLAGEVVPFEELPSLLRLHSVYLDFKGLTSKGLYSKTGLEALACGLRVITDDLLVTESEEVDLQGRLAPFMEIYGIFPLLE